MIMVIHNTPSRRIFCVFNYAFFILLTLICVFPIWYVLIQSFSAEIVPGKGLLLPYRFTLSNYERVFRLKGVFPAFGVSISRTLLGTLLTLFSCMLLGYLFTKEKMPFRKFLYRYLIITMYISGGLIPTYLVTKAYGLLNTFWVYVLPSAVSANYVILIKTYVEQLPSSVEESAMIDGAGVFIVFLRIILPMSLPIMATIAVYASVAQWNSWFDNHIYTFTSKNLTTLQYMLYNYLNEAEKLAKSVELTGQEVAEDVLTPKAVRMTITMITILPVIMFFPFLQRFFIKGITLGAVKG